MVLLKYTRNVIVFVLLSIKRLAFRFIIILGLFINYTFDLTSGASRKFVTERVKSLYGMRWNSFFTCSDLTTEDVSRSELFLSLWADYFQKGETKIGKIIIFFLSN